MTAYQEALRLLNKALDMEILLPECYAAYRPAIRDGLARFLESLPMARKLEIFRIQQAFDDTVTVFERFTALLRCCPTLHKLGQIMARNEDLSLDLRLPLQALESLPPSSSLEQLAPLMEQRTDGHIKADGAPLAEASVAVVVPFVAGSGEKGVAKMQRPGIAQRLREELEIWPRIGEYLEERCGFYGIPALEYRATFECLQTSLLNELDLSNEQRNMSIMSRFYADSPEIVIPALFPWCSSEITTMERIFGGKITDHQKSGRAFNRELGSQIVQNLLSKPFWSIDDTVLFHGDPHSGNLFLTEDQRVALLDWSLVVALEKDRRKIVMQILLAALMHSRERIMEGLASLSCREPERSKLREVVDESLSEIRRGAFPSFQWMVALLDRSMTSAGLTPAEDMILFRKVILTLLSVVRDVSSEVSADEIMTTSAFFHLLREAPERMLKPFGDDTGRGHLKTRDLTEIFMTWPLTAGRYWCGVMRDVLGRK